MKRKGGFITLKKKNTPVLDPCINVRKGGLKEFAVNYFDPASNIVDYFNSITGKKVKKNTKSFKRYCLYAKRGKMKKC